MSKVYGYVRISTKKQSLERQVRNIEKNFEGALIVKEVYTGKNINRPEFDKLLAKIKSGDTIVFDSVSRMSRNAQEGFDLYKKLYNQGVNLVFLKEPHINTETYRRELERQINLTISTGDKATDELMTAIFDALNKYILNLAERQINLAFEQSQKEVDDLRQRTKEGIETARLNGKQIGGHKDGAKITVKKRKPITELICKYSKCFNGNLTDKDVITIINATDGLKVSRNTYYKYKREMKELQRKGKA